MQSAQERFIYDDEEQEESLPFEGLEKTSVLQQCRVFNEVKLDISACVRSMLQCLHLMYTGTVFTEEEATELFFMSTKLFQTKELKLRRLHYVLLKELSPHVAQSLVASNSLNNDIKNNTVMSKSNSIRTLFKVLDGSYYESMSRTIAEALTSQNEKVVCAALVTALHIAQKHNDMVRKWSMQLIEVVRGNSNAQYLAIALLHKLRRSDRVSVKRLIEMTDRGQIRSSHALCLLIRICSELMREDLAQSKDLYNFVSGMMHNYSDTVAFEAVKAICLVPGMDIEDVSPAVIVANSFLRGHKTVLRFASIRLLSEVSTLYPGAVARANAEIENLVLDSNRVIAMLAATTLLKTGAEETIERLIARLSADGFMRDLGNEFKSGIIDAMRRLNTKYPAKYAMLLEFLSKVFSNEGSSELKESAIDVMFDIAKSNPSSKEVALKYLVEFIEDCEFPQIVCRVLTYLGDEVPRSAEPRSYVRGIYSHATLEKPEIRAVAVSTLAKIAAQVTGLRRSIVGLLRHKCNDIDDEVRDRALLYTKLFLHGDEKLIQTLVVGVSSEVSVLRQERMCSRVVPLLDNVGGVHTKDTGLRSSPLGGDGQGESQASQAVLQGREHLLKIEQLCELGEPCTSTEPVLLTDCDNEYVVKLIKHIYTAHIVLQYCVKNTMDNITLRQVSFVLGTDEMEVEPFYAIPVDVVPGATEYSYVVLRYEEEHYPSGTVACSINFTMEEDSGARPADGEVEEYTLEDFDINISDFIVPVDLKKDFHVKWESLQGEETSGTYALSSMRNLTVAARELVDFFGMHVAEGKVEKVTTPSHTLLMSGALVNRGRSLVLINARVFITEDETVALQLTLRGATAELREYLSASLLS
ncbi:putative coatomer gamma subunit [Trypanosoma vivax]|nr:putative coatomer gamma subunit [Trypanosoma vivax]